MPKGDSERVVYTVEINSCLITLTSHSTESKPVNPNLKRSPTYSILAPSKVVGKVPNLGLEPWSKI